jgi:hypothetical protein
MLKDDFVIQSTIRRTLVRSNIDYSKINFGTVKGIVYIQGAFEISRFYTDGTSDSIQEFMRKTLVSLEKKIRTIPGVIDVNFRFLNWKKERGQWIPKKEIEE